VNTQLQPVNQNPGDQAVAPRTASDTPLVVGQAHEFNLRDILDVVMRRWPWMLLTFSLVVVLGTAWTITRPKAYASSAEVAVPENKRISLGPIASLPGLDPLKDLANSRTVETQMRMLQSVDFRKAALANLPAEVEAESRAKPPVLNIASGKDSGVITISVTAASPKLAAAMANSVVDTFIVRDQEESKATTTQAVTYIDGEMKRVQGELTEARKRLAEFETDYRLPSADDRSASATSEMARLQAALDATEGEATSARETMRVLKARMSPEDVAVAMGTAEVEDEVARDLRAQIAILEKRRVELLVEYELTAPAVVKVEAEIAAVTAKRNKYMRDTQRKNMAKVDSSRVSPDLQRMYTDALARHDAAESRATSTRARLAAEQARVAQMPAMRAEAAELLSAVKQYEQIFAQLAQSYQTLRITEASSLSNVRVLSKAVERRTPVSPKVGRNILMLLALGLLLACVAAVVIDSMDDRIHAQETLHRMSPLPVLASIPLVPEETSPQLIENQGRHSPVLEGMRLLRGNLTFAALDRATRIIAVTSAGAGEGKSTTALNLAIAMAMDGKRVIIVDADLRRPSQHNYFGLPRTTGLTSVLTGQATLDEAIQETAQPGVSLLATGPLPPNPPEVLNSQQTRQLIADLGTRYDAVIVDTPPAAGLSDTPIIATMVDGILIVVSANQTRKGQLQFGLGTLEQVDAPVLGFVFNKMGASGGYYSYYYYYYYYNNYYTADPSNPDAPEQRRSGRSNRRRK
jgi:capsular exopolysaccharide synthesis family protein